MKPYAQISRLEKLDLLPGIISIFWTILCSVVTGPFRGRTGAYTFGQHVCHTTLRKALERFNALQIQHLGGNFSTRYEDWCKSQHIRPAFVLLASGCKALCLGDHRNAKYIMIYYHGGGFAINGDHSHLGFWKVVADYLSMHNINIAILFLEYSLVPHATYPTQLCQAIELCNYVVTELHRPASEIILAGDSAGGNLCLGVLSQIMHPASFLPKVNIEVEDNFKAFILVAPWVTFRADYPNAERNKYKDLVSSHIGKKWSEDYLGSKETSFYAEPANAPAHWWANSRVERLLTVFGEDEVLADAVKEWTETYKSGNPNGITVSVGTHEGHTQALVDFGFGIKTETEQGIAVKLWMKANL